MDQQTPASSYEAQRLSRLTDDQVGNWGDLLDLVPAEQVTQPEQNKERRHEDQDEV